MNKYSRLGKNTLLVFIGNIGSKLITLLMLPLYTRWLSVEDYGITDIISVYVMLLSGLVTGSIAESVFIFPKGQPFDKQKRYFSSGLLFALVALLSTAFIFAVVAYVFSVNSVENSFTKNAWLIYGLLVATFLQNYMQQFTRGIDRMLLYSVTGVVLTVATALFSFVLIPRYGVLGYVLCVILANIVSMGYSFLSSKGYRYFHLNNMDKECCIEMLKYSVPLIPNAVMWWLIAALNRPIMEVYSGTGSIGLFAVANKFPSIVTMIFAVFFSSWQISVMEEFGKKDYKQFYNKIFKVLLLVMVLSSCLMSIFSPYILKFMTTPDFHSAWRYIPLLSLAPVFQAISSFVGANFSAVRKTKYLFYSGSIGALFSIILNLLLIPVLGIWGAVLALILSHCCMAVSRIIFSWGYVKITSLSNVILTIAIAVGVSLSITFINDILYRASVIGLLLVLLIWVYRITIKETIMQVRNMGLKNI